MDCATNNPPGSNLLQLPANSDSNYYFPSVYLHTPVMNVPLEPFHSDKNLLQ